MEKVTSYVTGFLGGLVSIMMAIVPVTILWTLLTGEIIFGIDIISNFMVMLTSIGSAGFIGLVTIIFVLYFFMCEKCK
tara:strand:- start:593 stop:826 length:234 start_codon:yes stop_codon:yes gene_type:complete